MQHYIRFKYPDDEDVVRFIDEHYISWNLRLLVKRLLIGCNAVVIGAKRDDGEMVDIMGIEELTANNIVFACELIGAVKKY